MLPSLVFTSALMGVFGTPAFADTIPTPQDFFQVEPLQKVQQLYDSCVSGVRVYVPTLPHMDAKWFAGLPHSSPAVGNVVVMQYPNDVWHIAYILSMSEEGFTVFEYNYHHGKKDTRVIAWNDPAIYSFFAPALDSS